MSTKVLHSLTHENHDLHKQVGCMNGMFQLFNRRHSLPRERISSHKHKRLPPGQSGNHRMEPDSTMRKPTEINLGEVVKEKRRVSVESSRTSLSSSCSSTFSSFDCNKTSQHESSLGHINFLEAPSQILSHKHPNSSPCLRQQSPDLRDVVKDSIKREACGLSVETTPKAERKNHVLKHIDSPRPLQPAKPVKTKVYCLDGSLPLKDSHRFSYDGRESLDTGQSAIKFKETPRLSLDSRQSSNRRSASESRSNYLLEDLERRNVGSRQTVNPQQEPRSNKGTSGAVAKLMGLEAFPDAMDANIGQMRKIKCCADEDLDAMSTTSRKLDENKQYHVSRSPRTPQRKPVSSPGSRTIDSVLKPNSRFPLEQAPWRKTEGNGSSEKTDFIYQEAQVQTETIKQAKIIQRTRNSSSSVIPIEGMSGLRKLRISENANTKKDSVEKRAPNHLTPRNRHFREPSCQLLCSMDKSSNAKTFKSTQTSKAFPIEGMSGLHKLRIGENANTKKDPVEKRAPNDLTPRNSHFREPFCQLLCSINKSSNAKTFRSTQTSKEPQNTSRGNSTMTGRSSMTVSPRLQQKQHGMENQSRPATQRSDPSKSRKQLSKQQTESGSPGRESKPKSLIELSSETRQLSHQSDAISVQSESNISSASQTDTEVTSIYRSNEIYGARKHKNQRNNIENLEKPSPVSVLDTTFYREGSPSPVKKTSNAFKEWTQEHLQDLLNSAGRNSWIDFGREKSENIEHLVHKLGQVNSTQDKPSIDNVSSFCENTNPEHQYIKEILLASGLLFKDLVSSFTFNQHHPSGHLINPNLFLVLEQTRGRIEQSDNDCTNEKIDHSKRKKKIHRKLMFDTVNEILVSKLTSEGYSGPRICPSNLGVKTLKGHKLLKELFSEVDQLQAIPNCSIYNEDDGLRSILSEDRMYQTPTWEDCHCEIPGIVLEIERLIFKDLINEVVSGEVTGHPGRPATHCKRFFPD